MAQEPKTIFEILLIMFVEFMFLLCDTCMEGSHAGMEGSPNHVWIALKGRQTISQNINLYIF